MKIKLCIFDRAAYCRSLSVPSRHKRELSHRSLPLADRSFKHRNVQCKKCNCFLLSLFMPALALAAPLQSNALRSVPWAPDIAPRFIDILDGREVPRALVGTNLEAATQGLNQALVGTSTITELFPTFENIVIKLVETHSADQALHNVEGEIIFGSQEISRGLQLLSDLFNTIHENSAQDELKNAETSFGQFRTAIARIINDISDLFPSETSKLALADAKKSLPELQSNLLKLQAAINNISSKTSANLSVNVSGNLTNTASGALANDNTSSATVSTDSFQKWAPIVVGLLGANLGVALLVVVAVALMYLHKRRESGSSPHHSKSSYRPLREPDSDKFMGQNRSGEDNWPYSENQ
ncbi:hypothetical protein DL96DRAFT_1820672 [Flagelloscypha sp. PMI_526]|nr:hypothetical protein DL96DRAFT_1820672 [Flagelloscypha sp. PMI_526]